MSLPLTTGAPPVAGLPNAIYVIDALNNYIVNSNGAYVITKLLPALGDVRRRIPIERLREILRAQGSPWADELEDTYRAAEKRVASPKTSKKLRKVLEQTLEKVSEHIAAPLNWGPVIASLLAATAATRSTLAIKHAEIALSAIREDPDDEDDDEEVISLFMRLN